MNSNRIIPGLEQDAGPLGLGTWLMNGFHWTDAEDAALERALEKNLELGGRLIDTAPIYGYGRSEEVIGRVLKRLGKRQTVLLATKFGLEWNEYGKNVRRNASKRQLMKDLDKSRRRLQTDVIDLYQVHWPDPGTPIGETMDTLLSFYEAGLIKGIGLCNFSVEQMAEAGRYAPLHTAQVPLNLFEQGMASEVIPFCRNRQIAVLAYSPLCRGLLSGKFKKDTLFQPEDIRAADPKFSGKALGQYLQAVQALKEFSQSKKAAISQLALSWVFHVSGVFMAIAGARNEGQADENAGAKHVPLSGEDLAVIDEIITRYVPISKWAVPLPPPF